MSTRIGGPHQCNIHPEFTTEDTKEFNEHCRTAEGHTTSGHYPCIGCGTDIEVIEIPHQDLGGEVRLQCPDCFNKNQDLNKLINSSQNQNQQIEGGEQA